MVASSRGKEKQSQIFLGLHTSNPISTARHGGFKQQWEVGSKARSWGCSSVSPEFSARHGGYKQKWKNSKARLR